MEAIMGWTAAALPVVVAVVLISSAIRGKRGGLRDLSSGAAGAFDAVWSPTAEAARDDWDQQQRLPVEAPSPDKDNPERDALERGRIVIRPKNTDT